MGNTIEQVVRELKDISDIRQLKARYCLLVDQRDWGALEQLWTDDASADYHFMGQYPNKRAIMDQFFPGVASNTSFTAHMVHNDIIEVDGDSAKGHWYLTAHSTGKSDQQAMIIHGFYSDEFRRIDGEWKIKTVTVKFRYFSPYEDGWGKTPFPPMPEG